MKNVLLALLGSLETAAPAWPAHAQSSAPTAKLLATPLPAARPLPPVVSEAVLTQHLGAVPAQLKKTAKARNVVFMNDCLVALTGHVKQFSEAGQRSGLTLAQLRDTNDAFMQVVADLRDAYDQEESGRTQERPQKPAHAPQQYVLPQPHRSGR